MTLTERETFMLNHITRFGSEGYPVRKAGRYWVWEYGFSPEHPDFHSSRTMYRTKKEAVHSFELHLEILRDKKAGRL